MALGALQVDVYVSPVIATVTGNPDPKKQLWSPISTTLVQGPSSAAIIDTAINISQNEALADWVERTAAGKKITHLFITHAHADHFLGAPLLQKRFPGLQVVASARVAEGIRSHYDTTFDLVWSKLFPDGQLSNEPPEVTALPPSNEFTVDGHIFRAIDVGQTDCAFSSVLHVPSLDLVVGGDVIYGDCYQHLKEANTASKRQEWIDALTMIEGLNPKVVVPGHKRATQIDGAYLLQATKQYIRDFERELEGVKNQKQGVVGKEEGAKALEARMKALYPARWNDFILEWSCQGAFEED